MSRSNGTGVKISSFEVALLAVAIVISAAVSIGPSVMPSIAAIWHAVTN